MSPEQRLLILKTFLGFEKGEVAETSAFQSDHEAWREALTAFLAEAPENDRVVIAERVLDAIEIFIHSKDHCTRSFLSVLAPELLAGALHRVDQRTMDATSPIFRSPGGHNDLSDGVYARGVLIDVALGLDLPEAVRAIACTPVLQSDVVGSRFMHATVGTCAELAARFVDAGISRSQLMEAILTGKNLYISFDKTPSPAEIVSSIAQGSLADLEGFAQQIESALKPGRALKKMGVLPPEEAEVQLSRIKAQMAMRATVAVGPIWAAP